MFFEKNKCDFFSVINIPLSLYYSLKERQFSALSCLLYNFFLPKPHTSRVI